MHVRLETHEIVDWASFHEVCRRAFGFPEFYGRNLDAWIDCLTYARDGDGMSRFHLGPDERLEVEVAEGQAFRARLPEVAAALEAGAAAVNQRQAARGEPPVLALTWG